MLGKRIPFGLLLVALGCESGPPVVTSGPQESSRKEGALWEGQLPAGYASWPPPYFYYFAGFAADRDLPPEAYDYQGGGADLAKVLADSRSLYLSRGGAWSIDHANSQESAQHRRAELFYEGGFWWAGSDDEKFYIRGLDFVLQLGIQDRSETRIPLDWDHSASDAFLVTANYVYTAMPGCAALTRIDKKTLEKSVMYVEGVQYPGRGNTALSEATDGRIVCASPTDIFAIDRWGDAARNLHSGIQELFGVTIAGDQVYWIQSPSGGTTSIGRVSLEGGEGVNLAEGDGREPLVHSAAIGKLVWRGHHGLRAMDLDTNEIKELDLSNEGRAQPVDLTLNGDTLFVAMDGHATTTADGKPLGARAFWIARVPVEDLE